MQKFFLAFSLFFISVFPAKVFSQTFSGTGGSVPDAAPGVSFQINVSGLVPSTLDTANFGIEQVCLTLTHTYDSDLSVSLKSPDGTIINLFSGVGGGGDNFTNTCLRQDATNSISTGSAPFSAIFKPQGDMGLFNNLQNGNGIWTLFVQDNAGQDTGSVINWNITFGNNPATPFVFVSSNIPLVLINTFGQNILDDPKILADLKVIDNGFGNRNYKNDTIYNYHGSMGIELRGSSSQSMPKKSYGIELWDTAGLPIKQSVLDMPPQSDWVLLANYSDKTLMRNELSYFLARNTGHYAVRTRFCELLINGEYQGVYVFAEKIKRDSSRVNIAKLTPLDTTGAELTGGYIIKIDKFTGSGGDGWSSSFPPPNASGNPNPFIQYQYPNQVDIHPKQAQYIQAFTDSFETALASPNFQDPQLGWRNFMSESSVIDYMIINEMSKNVDGYRLSTFLHKEKITDGNKLKMGPVWDYDIAWHNADYCNADEPTGWAYNLNYICTGPQMIPFWWERWAQDSVFNKKLYCRYTELRQSFLHNDSLFAKIDSNAALLNESQNRNFYQWPILGTYVWPNPAPIGQTYADEVQHLKDWVTARMQWMDSTINLFATPFPTVFLGNDTSFCTGSGITLYAGNQAEYLWNSGSIIDSLVVTQSGVYSVSVQNEYGCSASDTIDVTVFMLPNSNFNINSSQNFQFTFVPTLTVFSSYTWNFGDGTAESNLMSPTHNYSTIGDFTVTLTVVDTNGCTSSSTQIVHAKNTAIETASDLGNLQIYPNPFQNDLFIQSALNGTLEIEIFNVEGKKVYKVVLEKAQTNDLIQIYTQSLKSGIYLMRITGNGKDIFTQKIIKP